MSKSISTAPLHFASFFNKFPEHGGDKDFFITGESYAGIYVPTLAEAIVNSKGKVAIPKGIAVGNGCTGTEIGVCGHDRDRWMGKYFATATGLLSQDLKAQMNDACEWDNTDEALSAACLATINEMENELGYVNSEFTWSLYFMIFSLFPVLL